MTIQNQYLANSHLRIARPTDQLSDLVEFYTLLGFSVIGSFKDHAGFDGVMLGHPQAGYHLEFTHQPNVRAGKAPSQEHLLVFYIPCSADWQATTGRLIELGLAPETSHNPYWDQNGLTFEDPDGYRIVFYNGSWPTR